MKLPLFHIDAADLEVGKKYHVSYTVTTDGASVDVTELCVVENNKPKPVAKRGRSWNRKGW